MKLIKEVRHGEMIPPWYGVAWTRYDLDSAMCFPVPINMIAGLGRAFVIFVRYGYLGVKSNPRDAFHQGYVAGKSEIASFKPEAK